MLFRSFLPSPIGTFTCLSTDGGKTLWSHEFPQGGYASPILVGDLIYWMTSDGTCRIFRAQGAFENVAAPSLGEKSMCTPAFVGDRIYARGDEHLFCIGEAK